jgi:hypothetical protein
MPCRQSCKTVYGRNLRIFVIARVFVPDKPFQPSLMYAGKAEANSSKFRKLRP